MGIMVVTFDGASGSTLMWKEQNDPVMGGQSTGTFVIDKTKQIGTLNGTVKIVPFLKAPGVIHAIASGTTNDVSNCKSLVLNVNSKKPYSGYKISFGNAANAHYPGKPFYQHGFLTAFQAPVGEFGDVVLPFNNFTLDYEAGSGKPASTCATNPKACPTAAILKDLKEVSIWAEGVLADIHLEIKSIRATGCGTLLV